MLVDIVLHIVQAICQILHDICPSIHIIYTNSKREFVNKAVLEYYDLVLSIGAYGSIYPRKNGAAERNNRTLMELVCRMIHSQKTPFTFGPELLKPPSMLLTKPFLVFFHMPSINPDTVNAPSLTPPYFWLSSLHLC